MKVFRPWVLLLGAAILPLLVSCNEGSEDPGSSGPSAPLSAVKLAVYKSPSCGCCNDWIDHAETEGFEVTSQHPANINAIKDRHDIPVEVRSCHTGVSTEGYVFEGHVPARYVRQFLSNPPAGAIGLAVPGMPIGSPGMEVGDRFTPYSVLLVKDDGTTEVFARVDSADAASPVNADVADDT